MVPRNLDRYEEERNYILKWEQLSKALNNNNQIKDVNTMPWILRDTMILSNLFDEKRKERGDLL